METDLAILIGLQASGKSTFYRQHLAGTHVLVSKDRLRNNKRPARRQAQLIREALEAGQSVAVDNTNATVELRKELIDLAREHGASVTGYYFSARLPHRDGSVPVRGLNPIIPRPAPAAYPIPAPRLTDL